MPATPQPDASALTHLLAPYSPSEFIGRHADQRALLIPGSEDKFASLDFDVDQFFTAAQQLDPAGNRLKAAGKTPNEAERYVPIGPQQARPLFDAGMTICAAGLSDAHPGLGAFAESIRHALSVPDLRFNAYLSPDGSGFNLHYDVQPIFLIQIAGAKHWWYSAEPVTPLPRCYSSSWDAKPDPQTLERTLLTPGDVLYLPAFSWHRARAEGFSLGITLGTKGAHNEPLRTLLGESPFFGPWPECGMQPPLAPEDVRGAAVPSLARPYLEAQLDALQRYANELTVETLWETWVRQMQVSLGPRVELGDEAFSSEDTLVPDAGFAVSVVADGTDHFAVHRATRSARFEASNGPLLDALLALRSPVAVTSALELGQGTGLTRSETRRVIRDLLALGALERRTGS